MSEPIPLKPFFPRGPGPLIEVFIPTRGRPRHLAEAIDSCHSLAKDPSLISYTLKVDEDDLDTVHLAEHLATILPIKVHNTPRGNGYADIHLWLDAMRKASSADFLYYGNDDSRIQTQDWDQYLLLCAVSGCWHACVQDVCLIIFETNGIPDSNESVCVRRKTVDIMGHCSLSPYGDSWIYQVCDIVQSFVRFPLIKVKHGREEVKDTTRASTSAAWHKGRPTLIGFDPIRAKMRDAERLLSYIEGRHRVLPWRRQPSHPGWYYFRPADGSSGRYLMVLDGLKVALNPLGGAEAQPLPLDTIHGDWTPL